MARSLAFSQLETARRRIRVGDFVRIAKHLGTLRADRDFRRVFRQIAGQVFPVVGWDATGLAWIPLRGGEVLSVAPELLVVVRRCRVRKVANGRNDF